MDINQNRFDKVIEENAVTFISYLQVFFYLYDKAGETHLLRYHNHKLFV